MTSFKHGYAATRDPAYRAWEGAKQRCRNPNVRSYADYGGRGIRFCAEWDSFVQFISDMGPQPPGSTLDRIDNDGHYEPGNCRWATTAEQARNKRSNQWVEYEGKRLTIKDLASYAGVPYSRLYRRIRRWKWPVGRAVNEPPKNVGFGRR